MAAATLTPPSAVAPLDPSTMPTDVLENELCRRAANLTAAEAEWLALVAEFDRRQAWITWGCPSCAAWLAWHVGLDIRAAREKVRVANALEHLPLLAAAMARGQVSYTKVRALTRIATDHNEAELVDLALTGTSGHVERIVAAYRRCEPAADDAEARAHRDRGLWIRSDDAECEFTVRLPAEAAKAVLGAIDVFLDGEPGGGTHAARRVDALVALAEHAVATASDVGRFESRYLATVVLTPDVFDPDHADGGGVLHGCNG